MERMRCSFCHKRADEVVRMIAGPSVVICNECVVLCTEILGNSSPLKGWQLLVRMPEGTHNLCAQRTGWSTLVHLGATYSWCEAELVRPDVTERVLAVRQRGIGNTCFGATIRPDVEPTEERARSLIGDDRHTNGVGDTDGSSRHPFRASAQRPSVAHVPTDEDRKRVAAWRSERTLSAAWKNYCTVATDERWERDCGVYGFYSGTGTYDSDRLELSAGADARVLLVCEKTVVRDAVDVSRYGAPARVTHSAKAALAWVRPLPSAWTSRALHDHAKRLKAPLAFFGDLDPQALHFFAAIRAGGRDALLRSRVAHVPIRWVGLDGRWLDLMCRHLEITEIPSAWTIKMNWLDMEYWQLVKRMVPDVRTLLGARGFALLEGGSKIEVDAFMSFMRQPLLAELDRRLRRLGRR